MGMGRNLGYKRLQNEDLTLEIMSSDSLDPRRPCHRLRVNLKICLLQTDCCRIEKKTPKECLLENKDIPEECQALRLAFFECERSVLDMRTRFRGRKGDSN